MEQPKRQEGGMEKLRAKRVKNFTVDAAKCAKITDMFTGGAAVASTSSVTAMLQQQQVEGEGGGRQFMLVCRAALDLGLKTCRLGQM